MHRPSHYARGAVVLTALTAAIILGSCTTPEVFGPSASTNHTIFASYVSIGNSLTAGYQSGGINDSTQQRSYAVLLAKQMGTRFNYPSLNGGDGGCRMVVNFVTQALIATPPVGTPCLRNTSSVSDIVNNVAVPGAASIDPTSASTANSNGLTTLILGGKTQVQAALLANPTFVSIWIGNNDVLPAAEVGLPAIATAQATFVTNYDAMISQLLAGAPNLKGMLIGVVNVTYAPVFFSSAALKIPAFLAGLGQAAGTTITTDNTCTGTDGSLISLHILTDIKSGAHPPVISCTGGSPSLPDDVLTLAEQAQFTTIVNGYNAFIQAKADSIGFAYYNPNTTLVNLINEGLVPSIPNLASPTAPFGIFFTLDGVHPSDTAHVLLAGDMVTQINAKYGTNLIPPP